MCIPTVFFSFAVQLLLTQLAQASIILHQQCWHERLFNTINLQSSVDGRAELAHPIQLPFGLEGEDYAPWSYPPTCGHALESINDKLCVYTDRAFSNGRGISIFTTPKLAAQLAALPPFKDRLFLARDDVNTFSGTWNATSIPNKGIGMLASKALVFKARVTAYTPAFLAYLEHELSTQEREQWWRRAIEQLPEKIRKDFLQLAYVYGDERVRVQDIVKANTFQIEIGGVNHLAVFPETSRLNHACNPNAQYVIDADHLTHTVHATRPIAEGEEITISYTSPLDPTAQRQQHLQTGFHFTCTCPRCTSPTSDTTLKLIHTLQSQLNDWSPSSPATPAMAEQLLDLYRDKGLEGFMDTPYGFAALAYSAVGDEGMAVRYAEKAREAVLLKDGEWVESLGIWEEMIRDVRGHWSWNRRV